MKVCPRCQRTYTDDNLNFCLDDGSVLSQAGGAAPLPDTVLINQPRMTASNQPASGQPGGWGSAPSSPSPQSYSMQPPVKSSKTWIWVVGILGLVALVCGGGLVGFFALVASQDEGTDNPRGSSTSTPSPAGTKSPTPSTGAKFSNTEEIDLSLARPFTIYGTTEFTDGEFLVTCNSGYAYFVLLVDPKYTTESALTTLTVRNVNDTPTERGFGLVFHSNPTPLQQDYAFLIDSKKKRYRVVRHEPQKELVVVKWTNFAGIKNGSEENVLEVRDDGDNLVLSINGEQATTIPDTYGYAGGSPGVYTSGNVKAAFSSMQVKK